MLALPSSWRPARQSAARQLGRGWEAARAPATRAAWRTVSWQHRAGDTCAPGARPLPFAGTQVPETDCVLATTELQELLEQRGVDLRSLQGAPFDSILPAPRAGAAPEAAGGGCSDQQGSLQHRQDMQQQQQAQPPAGAGSVVPASSGSGGYLEHVFRAAAWQLFGQRLPPGELQMTVGRNAGGLECSMNAIFCAIAHDCLLPLF